MRNGRPMIPLPNPLLKLIQEVQVIERELIQLKVVIGGFLFLFHRQVRGRHLFHGTNHICCLDFRRRRRADLLPEMQRGTDGLWDLGEFVTEFWELDAFGNRGVWALPDWSGLDDLLYFLLFDQLVLALDAGGLAFGWFGLFGFTFYFIRARYIGVWPWCRAVSAGLTSRSLSACPWTLAWMTCYLSTSRPKAFFSGLVSFY